MYLELNNRSDKVMFVSTQSYVDAWTNKPDSAVRLTLFLSLASLETCLDEFLSCGSMMQLKGYC